MANTGTLTKCVSEYELLREENIKRNEEFLKTIGLDPVKRSASENKPAKAVKRKRSSASSRDEAKDDEYFSTVEPRRSRRLQQVDPELKLLPDNLPAPTYERRPPVDFDLDPEGLEEEDLSRVKISGPELQRFIEESNAEHYEQIGNDLITHTAYRMSYMSSTKLKTRMAAIVRAAGKKSYAKLLAFYYALKLAKLERLASTAKEVLEGLGFDNLR